jgi:hypothetical protein
MKTDVILHVGFHKTGSSAIQDALQGYDDGVTSYANLGEPNHSIFFQTVFDSSQNDYYWSRLGLSDIEVNKISVSYIQKLKAQLANNRPRIVFSGENISVLDLPALYELKSFLQRYSLNQKVIVFVREPQSLVASLIQEHVKHSDLRWLDQGIVSVNLSGRIENLLKVFGPERVQILRYEDAQDQKRGYEGDIVRYFCDIAGLDHKQAKQNVYSNTSIEFITIRLLIKFYRTGFLHNHGEVLERVRWKFIECLNILMKQIPSKTINSEVWDSYVDWRDFIRLNKFIKNKYLISSLNSIDLQRSKSEVFICESDFREASELIKEYLCLNGMTTGDASDPVDLLQLLFFHLLREDARDTSR